MGRLERDIIISPTPSVVSICGKVPIQEAPNGLPCAVSDANWGSNARVYGSGRQRSTPLLHSFIFNYIFIFNEDIISYSMLVYFPGISFF